MDSHSQDALQGCVRSLQTSMQLMESSLNILDAGVGDFTRMCTVLQTTKHFELVSEPSLKEAQQTLLSSIEPELNNLLERVEAHLEKMARREQSLMAKAELQQGRLTNTTRKGAQSPARASTSLEALKMEQLRQKKQRLSYAVGRLELQATQRERQLRKSMAAV
ncbi:hypothetical protein AMS68_004785 [Peltaster fructicola]|uniref:DASH complex subunit SPC19 n=1 Tax=Peltaster fructicola TaxID=286661 RepID=A0A6H0XXE4_9PEZI|nr:hypothetical protein AMS68_004785 [Peltaster fructicola]